jgi:hypothetical protein
MLKWFMQAVRRAQKQFYALMVVLFVGATLVAPAASLAQNLGTQPATGQAVQGQTAAQPEGAFLNAVNWVCNVICPVGAGIAVVATVRRQNDAQDAILVAWVLILAIVGILYFLAYDRLHVRAGQLVELTVYPLLVGVFAWEVLRYKATKPAEMEEAWPRPIPFVSKKKEQKYLNEAVRRHSVLLGYDIYGEPFYWSNETRTMQANACGTLSEPLSDSRQRGSGGDPALPHLITGFALSDPRSFRG